MASYNGLLRKNWRIFVLIPGLIVILFGLIQLFILPHDFLKHIGYSPHTIPAYQTVDSDISYHRIQPTLRGANPLGAYLVLVIPAMFLAFKKTHKVVLGICTASVLVLLILTHEVHG